MWGGVLDLLLFLEMSKYGVCFVLFSGGRCVHGHNCIYLQLIVGQVCECLGVGIFVLEKTHFSESVVNLVYLKFNIVFDEFSPSCLWPRQRLVFQMVVQLGTFMTVTPNNELLSLKQCFPYPIQCFY